MKSHEDQPSNLDLFIAFGESCLRQNGAHSLSIIENIVELSQPLCDDLPLTVPEQLT